MTERRQVRAGRVGRPHGLDGTFHLELPSEPLAAADAVTVAGADATVERVGGTAARPLVRLRGVETREAAARLRGEWLLVTQTDADLGEGEYFADDLVDCEVDGIGRVRRVIAGTSCDVLEVGPEAVLVPFVHDAIRRVDLATRTIEVDRRFLGFDEPPSGP